MAVSLGPKARAEHALRDHDKRGALMTVWEEQGNPYKIETTAKRNGSMVVIMRNQSANLQARNGTTSPYPRHSSAKQSCTENFRRTSHTVIMNHVLGFLGSLHPAHSAVG